MEAARSARLAPDARREQLIRMGVELLGQRAYDRMSISELARAAGISKGLLYRYFPTKSDFVIAVLRQAREELEVRMALDRTLEPVARLDASLDAWLAYVEDHAAGFQALARARSGEDDAIRAELAEGRRARIAALAAFASELTDGSVAGSTRLETVIGGWIAFTEEIVARWLAHRALERDEVRHILRQAFLANLDSLAQVEDPAAI